MWLPIQRLCLFPALAFSIPLLAHVATPDFALLLPRVHVDTASG